MKPQFSTRWFVIGSMLATLTAHAGSFAADFNDGQVPAGVTMLDGAAVDTSGGPDGTGCMKLTAAVNDTAGGFVLPDLDPGNRIQTFVATFNVHMGNGSAVPADGFAFNFGLAPSTSTFGPLGIIYGAGLNGISVAFDAFDNGTGDDQEGPECCVRLYLSGKSPQLVARRKLTSQLKTGTDYVPVMIRMNVAGTLDVYLNNTALFTNLFLTGTEATGWRFSFTAKTGGLYQEHWIDDLNITTVQQPTYRHYVKADFPIANNSLANVTNAVVQIPFQNSVDTSLTTMTFNGVQVPIDWSGTTDTNKPIAFYDPHGLPPGSVNTVTMNLVDSSGPAETMTWTFSVTNAPLWKIAPSGRYWLGANEGNSPTCRSLAYNPISNILYAAISKLGGTNQIRALDPNTGADLFQLNTSIVQSGPNIPLNCIAMGDDGVLYGCGEANQNTSQLVNIYRWTHPDSSTGGELIYSGTFASTYRWGDCFAVRGNATNAEFIMDAQNGTVSAWFTPDGLGNWSVNNFLHGYTGNVIGRGISFGPNNSFFLKKKQASGTTPGLPLDEISLDSPGTILSSVGDYHAQLGVMGLDLSNNIAAGIFFASAAPNYDRLYLYDISNPSIPLQIATYYTNITATVNGGSEQCYTFPVPHVANANFIGQVVFGGGKIFAISANNGIIAVPEFPPVKTITPAPPKMTIVSSNGSITISWPVTGAGEVLQSNPTLAPAGWTNTGLTPVIANGVNSVTITPGAGNYYRLAK